MDNDNDGITNLGEFSYNSNPNSNDTDGDCILDADEIIWASQNSSISATDALVLEDADSDGVKDSDAYGCVPDVVVAISDEIYGVIDGEDECPGTAIGAAVDSDGCSQEQLSQDNQPDADTDGDGVIDSEDECADTPPNTATDSKGSGKQNQQKSINNSEGGSSSSGLNFMIILITLGAIVFGGALFFLLRNPNEDDGAMNIEDVEGAKTWDSNV